MHLRQTARDEVLLGIEVGLTGAGLGTDNLPVEDRGLLERRLHDGLTLGVRLMLHLTHGQAQGEREPHHHRGEGRHGQNHYHEDHHGDDESKRV